jgi:hypothetical protein
MKWGGSHILGFAALGCLKILPGICLERMSEIKKTVKVASNLRMIQVSYLPNIDLDYCHHYTSLQSHFVTASLYGELITLSV